MNQHQSSPQTRSSAGILSSVLLALLVLSVSLIGSAMADESENQPSKTDPAALAEQPYWPLGIRLADELVPRRRGGNNADVLIWLPTEKDRIRAVLLIPNNTDSKHFGEHAKLREVCQRHEVGIVYFRQFNTGIEHARKKPIDAPPDAPENIFALMEVIAEVTGITAFRHAPWITFGKSSRGEFPFRMGWNYPDRLIAGISYHGETPTWPIPPYAKKQDQSILYVNAMGQEEWDGTWYRHVRPCLLNYRRNNAWLPHLIVARGVGHGNYPDAHGSKSWGKPVANDQFSVLRTWDYLSIFVDEALKLRLPAEGYPTDAPLKLRQIDPDSGYLLHPRAIEEMLDIKWMAFREKEGTYQTIPWPEEKHPVHDTVQGSVDKDQLIRKATDVPADQRRDFFWLANETMVKAWLDYHSPSKPTE